MDLHLIDLHVDVIFGEFEVPLYRSMQLPFIPVESQTLSFGDGGHPTCVVAGVDYYVDRRTCLVSARMNASCAAHFFWILTLLVGEADFFIIDFEHAPEHPLLDDDAFVDVEKDGKTVGWTFADSATLRRAFATEWTSSQTPPAKSLEGTNTWPLTNIRGYTPLVWTEHDPGDPECLRFSVVTTHLESGKRLAASGVTSLKALSMLVRSMVRDAENGD